MPFQSTAATLFSPPGTVPPSVVHTSVSGISTSDRSAAYRTVTV
ncbi:Uncharacterised protein [Mycobacteroides abscessus]|nr:Uncharacterised protein [Mycobacteroides abscessus]